MRPQGRHLLRMHSGARPAHTAHILSGADKFPRDRDAGADPLTFIKDPGVADRLIATALPALAHSRTRLTATFMACFAVMTRNLAG